MEILPETKVFTQLPGNVKFGQFSYKETDLHGLNVNDAKTIIEMISVCATTIVKEHIDILVNVSPHELLIGEFTAKQYIVYVSFPMNTVIDTDHTTWLENISPAFTEKISWVRDENANSLEIPIYSFDSPIIVSNSFLMCSKVRRIISRSFTSDLTDDRGNFKRSRKS